jgi:hypothetical protein
MPEKAKVRTRAIGAAEVLDRFDGHLLRNLMCTEAW